MDPGIQPSKEHADLGAGQLMRRSDLNLDALALIQQSGALRDPLAQAGALGQHGSGRPLMQGCLHQLVSLD
jgi:hypothetical protein